MERDSDCAPSAKHAAAHNETGSSCVSDRTGQGTGFCTHSCETDADCKDLDFAGTQPLCNGSDGTLQYCGLPIDD